MKFRDDIDIENTWVVSDTHFGHDNIVGYCLRPEDHQEAMIAEWRAHVPDDATVLHLGDLSYRSNARFKAIIAKELTGSRKLLIRGNHDGGRYSFYHDSGFAIVKPFAIEYASPQSGRWKEGGYPQIHAISFAHYPWSVADGTKLDYEDDEMVPWHWRVHGHIHNLGYTRDVYAPFLRNHINISVEQTHYRPVNLKILLDAAILGHIPSET